jgi:hypothetical protein
VSNELGQTNISEVPTVVPTFSRGCLQPHISPELAKIMAVWPSLPSVAKAGILAMIDAANAARVNENGKP